MKTIYDLAISLANDPKQVADTQSLTLDDSRPNFGLKGTHGLYGSEEWWGNLFGGRKDLFWTDNPTGNLLLRFLEDLTALGALEKHPDDDLTIRWNPACQTPGRQRKLEVDNNPSREVPPGPL